MDLTCFNVLRLTVKPAHNGQIRLQTKLTISMGGRLPAVASMPANRAFLEFLAGQSDLPKKNACSYNQNRIGSLLHGNHYEVIMA